MEHKGAPATIMVVDDDADFLQLTRSALEREGFVVEALPTAPSWDDLRRSTPSVIFIDVQLGAENGLDICRAIKANKRVADLPVILISGIGADRLKDEALRCHADGFISKPFDMRLLINLAEHYSAQ